MAKTPDISALTQLCDALSDMNRLKIVLILASGESNVTGLCEKLTLKQPTVSHHLGLLRMLGVVVNTRKGKEVIYSLADNAKVSGGKIKISVPPYTLTIET